MTNRERLAELTKKLRDAAFQQDPIARAVIELVKLSAEEAKESLVSAEDQDIQRTQGAARAWARMFRELTTEPPSINKSGA